MALSPAERVALFPTGGAIPEALQIGRTLTIAQLTDAAIGGSTVILAEDRHLGKSSLLLAVVDRTLKERRDDRLVLSVDLRDGIPDSTALASRLLAQATNQDAGAKVAAMNAKGRLSRTLSESTRRQLRSAGEMLGESDEAAIILKLVGMLQPGQASLHEAFLALDAHGRAEGRRTIVMLDEAQDLARWGDSLAVQHEVAIAIKRAGSTVNFVLTGSEKHALLALYDEHDAPLHGLGIRFQLPEISRDDWVLGLRARFDQAEIQVDSDQLHQIVLGSEGHPLRTMLICAHALDWLEEGRVSAETVRRAVANAERHPSWNTG